MAQPRSLDDHAAALARQLRSSIFRQLGWAAPLWLAGCSPAPPSGEEEGGVTTNPSSSGNDSLEGEAEGEVGSTDDGTDTNADEDTGMMEESESDTDGIRLDVMPRYDIPPPPACTSMDLPEDEAAALYPECDLGPLDPNLGHRYFELCVDLPPNGDCSSICPPDQLCEGMELCYWTPPVSVCGPFMSEDGCCLLTVGEDPPPIGRPFWIDGEARLACAPELLDDVAAHWLALARGEHASVAAFARFIALLQRHAAPAQLIREAIAAAADEVRHTELALDLASRTAGRRLELGALAIDDALIDIDDLRAAVCAAVREGCIDETLAAHEALCLARVAEDAQVVAVLERIAADEARHAALAWRFVAWAIERHPQLRPVVAEQFALRKRGGGEQPASSGDQLALGCPSPGLRARWRAIGEHTLVRPCAAALLA